MRGAGRWGLASLPAALLHCLTVAFAGGGWQGYANSDQEMSIILQSVLAKNYPKVRKGLFVFPVNWFVQLFWDTLLKPLLSTLQPDIEDKVCPPPPPPPPPRG